LEDDKQTDHPFSNSTIMSAAAEKSAHEENTDSINPHTEHHKVTSIELHHDAVAPEAIGGMYEEMPAGYYRSPKFIGTVVVSSSIIHF
jgi:hypothetical protein